MGNHKQSIDTTFDPSYLLLYCTFKAAILEILLKENEDKKQMFVGVFSWPFLFKFFKTFLLQTWCLQKKSKKKCQDTLVCTALSDK
jgi:hypothetical protein